MKEAGNASLRRRESKHHRSGACSAPPGAGRGTGRRAACPPLALRASDRGGSTAGAEARRPTPPPCPRRLGPPPRLEALEAVVRERLPGSEGADVDVTVRPPVERRVDRAQPDAREL